MTCTWCLPRHRRPCNFLFLIADAVYCFYTVLGWAYIIHRRIYHGRVHAGAGRRRRGRRQGLRKQLHGLFARYVSYFERVAYFYCVTTMYIMLYTRLVNFIYIFFLPTCDESRTTVRAYCIRTYAYGMYSEVDHYYRNLTLIEGKKKENACMYIVYMWKMIFRPREAVRGRGSISAASECVFRHQHRRERCMPPPVFDGLLLPWYSGSGWRRWLRRWWWCVTRFSGPIFPPPWDLGFIYKLQTTTVTVPQSVFPSFD